MISKAITISITSEDIRDQLSKLISGTSHKEQILDTIMYSICATDPGLETLYKSLVGIDFTSKYKVGEEFYVKLSRLGSWQFDAKATEDAGLTFQGRVVAKIIQVDKYSNLPYQVTFTAMDKGFPTAFTYRIPELSLEEKDSIDIPPF